MTADLFSFLYSTINGIPLWYLGSLLLLVISTALVVIMKNIGRIMNISVLQALADIQFSEVLFSLMLLTVIYFLTSNMNIFIGFLGIECQDVSCLVSSVNSLLFSQEQKSLQVASSAFNVLVSKLKEQRQWRISIAVPEAYYPTFGYVYPSRPVVFESYLLTNAIQSAAMIDVIRNFVKVAGLLVGPLCLALGSLFRAFTPSARLGSTLIAVGITGMLILPSTILFFLQPHRLSFLFYNPSCPEVCLTEITAVSDDYGFYPSKVSEMLGEALSRNVDNDPSNDIPGGPTSQEEISKFINGEIYTLVGVLNGTPITLYSCEYMAKRAGEQAFSTFSTEEIERARLENLEVYLHTCPSFCRHIPYPKGGLCYLSARACSLLYQYDGKGHLCFLPTYDFTKLDQNYDGRRLKDILLSSNCYILQPLRIPTYWYSEYCPAECSHYVTVNRWGSGPAGYGACPPSMVFQEPQCKWSSTLCNIDRTCYALYQSNADLDVGQIVASVLSAIRTSDYDSAVEYLKKLGLEVYGMGACDVPIELRRIPPAVNCASCYVSSLPLIQQSENMLMFGLSDIRLKGLVLPLVAAFVSFAGMVGLSFALGGEIFIPGMHRLR